MPVATQALYAGIPVVAMLVYFLCVALGLPAIVAIIAAVLVLLAGIPTGGYGIGGRFGSGSRL